MPSPRHAINWEAESLRIAFAVLTIFAMLFLIAPTVIRAPRIMTILSLARLPLRRDGHFRY